MVSPPPPPNKLQTSTPVLLATIDPIFSKNFNYAFFDPKRYLNMLYPNATMIGPNIPSFGSKLETARQCHLAIVLQRQLMYS
jgi:hypothetical protein